MATAGIRYLAVIVLAAIMTVLLCIEIRGKKGFVLIDYLISWLPLGIFLMIDMFDFYLHISGSKYLQIGLAITIIYQMVRFGMDFSRQYKEAIRYQRVQRELYEAKVNVMVSQIRPHFMYNALSSIAILCKLNPETAYDATITFSDYLRGNMDSLKQTAPVPFTQELEHLKKYLYIEKLRFADKLNIEYDIQTTDFVLPQLSVQPLVENAVKHGVGMKKKGGTVTISTRETDDAYEVIIQDDGVGFDVNETKNDGRSHIGMENTRKRIKDMCGGEVVQETLRYDDATGTTSSMRSKEDAHDYRYFREPDLVTIHVPREKKEELRSRLPELPEQKFERYTAEYGIPEKDAAQLTKYRSISEYFDKASEGLKSPKTASNFIIGSIFRRLETEADKEALDIRTTPEQLGELCKLLESGKLKNNLAKTALEKMLDTGKPVTKFVSESDMAGLDDATLTEYCQNAISAMPAAVADYKSGKEKALMAVLGNVMKQSRGRADAGSVMAKLKELISAL